MSMEGAPKVENGENTLERMMAEADSAKEGVLGALEQQIEYMKSLGVTEDIVSAFETELAELRSEGKSWWDHLVTLKNKVINHLQKLFS